jgi:hypothetical protein
VHLVHRLVGVAADHEAVEGGPRWEGARGRRVAGQRWRRDRFVPGEQDGAGGAGVAGRLVEPDASTGDVRDPYAKLVLPAEPEPWQAPRVVVLPAGTDQEQARGPEGGQRGRVSGSRVSRVSGSRVSRVSRVSPNRPRGVPQPAGDARGVDGSDRPRQRRGRGSLAWGRGVDQRRPGQIDQPVADFARRRGRRGRQEPSDVSPYVRTYGPLSLR